MKILSPNKSLFILATALALFTASCGTVTTKTYTIDDVTMVAEGPLFDGSNTLQATVPIELKMKYIVSLVASFVRIQF